MKKIYIIFLLSLFSISVVNLKADCESAIFDAEAVEAYTMNFYDYENAKVNIVIDGLTENIYAKVIDDYSNEEKEYHFKDTSDMKVINFSAENILKNIKYKIMIYSEDSSCDILPLNTLEVNTIRFNNYTNSSVCIDNASKIEECSPFYDIEDMSLDEFLKAVELKTEANREKTILDYVKQYYLYVLIPIMIGTFIFVVSIIILKRRKKLNEI